MNRPQRGQSIIEYTLIVILVVLGIVVMGPYVLRSVNAHFKIWDDQVQDSFNDRLKQANADQVNLPVNCALTGDFPGACGPLKGKTVTCKENEKYHFRTFNPPGCYIDESCEADPECCLPAVRGDCGIIPIPLSPLAPRTSTIGKTYKGVSVLSPVTSPGTSTPIMNGCYYGERQIRQRCGSSSESLIGCIPDTFGATFEARAGRQTPNLTIPPNNDFAAADDDPSCAAICYGNILPTDVGELCKSPQGTTEITEDQPLIPIGTGINACASDPNAYQKCNYYCLGDFNPNTDITPASRCEILRGYQLAPVISNSTNDYSFKICSSMPVNHTITATHKGSRDPSKPENSLKPGDCGTISMY